MKIKINRNILIAMQMFATKDDSRYELTGINVEVSKRGCFVIATDGRRLAAIKAGEILEQPEHKTTATLVVDAKMLKAMPKSSAVWDQDVVMTFTKKTVEFSPYGGPRKSFKFEQDLIEADFPRWRMVVPSGEQPQPINPLFDWSLLADFAKVGNIINKNGKGITLRQNGNDAPLLVLIPSIPEFIGVIMSMRDSNPSKQAPDWATTEEVVAAVPPAPTPAPVPVPETPEPAKV